MKLSAATLLALASACGAGGGSIHQAADSGADPVPVAELPEDPAPVDDPPIAVCTTAKEQFAREVWGRVLGKSCVQCHAPGGIAAEQNAKLRLLPSTYPGFLDQNYENLAMVAKFSFDGQPVLLQKPIGKLGHGGGAPLSKDGDEYAILKRFIASATDDEPCEGAGTVPAEVVMLDADATFRKATLQLAGRLPTEDEREQLDSEGEAALAPLLEELMNEEAFIERIEELYNDQLLTDRYLPMSSAVNLLDMADYPGGGAAYTALDQAGRDRANLAIAREPLWIIGHVVRDELPFSEILTANYTLVNSGSAGIYGSDVTFGDEADATAVQSTQVLLQRGLETVELPHAGVLSTPAFLNRFPTTVTNLNRHRARKVTEFFLATDILKAADRPVDPSAAARLSNPTRDDAQCNVCHRMLDPIAGAFMKQSPVDQERYDASLTWHPEMFAPGFGEEAMETSDYAAALPWLAERIVADPRFVLSAVQTAFRGLTGQEPLAYPSDPAAENFGAQLTAWVDQDAFFRQLGQRFVDDDMRFKTLVRELILSPVFRAINVAEDVEATALPRFAAMGTGRLSSPERLAAKIKAVTGSDWSAGNGAEPYLLREYRNLYGGIDSDAVVRRLTAPNGIMTSIAARMANEISCKVTALDFTKASEDRLLFPGVDLSDVPEDGGEPIAKSELRIRRALVRLHDRVLGERLDIDDPEIDRSFALFVDTWREADTTLPTPCRATLDESGAALPADVQISSDPDHTIRAWMAVMTYLLSDYNFIYEP
jgi:hypothetical protein